MGPPAHLYRAGTEGGGVVVATVAKSFNLVTAVQDFAGEGREIECPKFRPGEDTTGHYARRQMLLKVNGWTFSAVWGFGTYCAGARPNGGFPDLDETPPAESPDAEIAVWKGDGPMIELGDDTVAGWIAPAAFIAAVEAAERNDELGIRSALVRLGDLA
jgi:hypothetical protein